MQAASHILDAVCQPLMLVLLFARVCFSLLLLGYWSGFGMDQVLEGSCSDKRDQHLSFAMQSLCLVCLLPLLLGLAISEMP